MRFLRAFLVLLVVAGLTVLGLRLLYPLPSIADTPSSTALPVSKATALGAALVPLVDANPGSSGVLPLFDGRDALAARIILARLAEESIDLQYYIWQKDTTSWLLLDELRAAAERGVRVRLLLDDNGIPGLDRVVAELNTLENIEVRLFNPFTLRNPKLLSYGFDFFRLNRRMHNKSMTVDGIATIVGGRNIGDIYFAYGEGAAYFDLDAMAIGPAATDVAGNFDLFWSSESSYPVESIIADHDGGLAEMDAAVVEARESARGSDYVEVLDSSPLAEQLRSGEDILEWVDVEMVSDDPSKGQGAADSDNLLVGRLPELLQRPNAKVDVVSAYLIPGEDGTALFEGYLADGIETRLMTNSLEATDVPVVHSAWVGYRDRLIRQGAEVLELRARPDIPEATSLAQLLGGSMSSLHAKTFSVDDARVFIGSFNLDPRSVSLNTEMGFLIESPTIAASVSEKLDQMTAVYEVQEGNDGKIQWVETFENGQKVIHTHEPNTSTVERGIVRVFSWLPFEWML